MVLLLININAIIWVQIRDAVEKTIYVNRRIHLSVELGSRVNGATATAGLNSDNVQCCLLCFKSMNIMTDPAPRLSIFDIAYRLVLRSASCRTSKGRSELLKRVLGVLLYSYI